MLLRKLLIFFIVLIGLQNHAQFLDKTFYLVDSLEKKESNKNDFVLIEANLKLYKEAKSDTLKLEILNQIAENCYDENIWPKYNRLMYTMATNLILKEKDPEVKAKYLNAKALAINNFGYYIQNFTKNPNQALALYQESAKIFKETGFKTGLATSNNNIANLLYNNGKILEALDIYHETIKIQQDLKTVGGLTPLLNNIAETYIFIGDSAKAYIYLKRALASALQAGDKHMIAQELQNVGVLANYRGQTAYAIACMKRAMTIRQEIGDLNGVCKSKINLSIWLLKEKKYTTSKQYLDEIEPYVTNTDNFGLKYLFFSGYGQYYLVTNEPEKAAHYLEQGLKYTRASKSIQDEHKIISLLLEAYETFKNDDKELALRRRNAELNKILNGSEIKRNALQKNYEFEYAKKEQDYKIEQAIKDEKSKSEKRRQQFITYGILVFLLLALIFSFFIFKAFKITKQKNNIISTQKQEVEKQKHLIEEKQKEIVDSINYAKRIQSTLLANEDVLKKNLSNHFILFKPKDIVSGDFYWANSIVDKNTNLFFLASCDSTGHGVPGAFMSLLNTNFLNEAINEKHIYEPNNVFNYVRERLINSISKESQKDGFDGILICIDKINNKVTYSAANNSPILIKQNKEIVKLTCDKMPVGKGEINATFNLYTINYEKGDSLYLYTDGFADQFGGPKGKKYKYKPLNDFIVSINNLPFNKQYEQLNSKFQDWKGDLEQVDDVCIVGIQL